MAATLFARDLNGKRITTNILVYGYITDIGKEYQLLISDDIKRICFTYWLTKIEMESSKIEKLNTAVMRYYKYMGEEDKYGGKIWWFCEEYGIDDDTIDEEIEAEKDAPGESCLADFYDEYGQQFPLQDSNLSEDEKRKAVGEIIVKCYEHPNWDWEAAAMLPKCIIHIHTNSL